MEGRGRLRGWLGDLRGSEDWKAWRKSKVEEWIGEKWEKIVELTETQGWKGRSTVEREAEGMAG